MRKTLFVISCFFLISCEFDFQIDKKITVDEFIIEELKSFNWNEVDQYPVFESCLKIENIDNNSSSKNLIFFENDLNLEKFKIDKYQNIYSILLDNEHRKIKLDGKVLEFKKKLIANTIKTFSKNIKSISNSSYFDLLNEKKDFDVIYPSIGENKSFLNNLIKKADLKINFLKDERDIFCWKFSNKGYFNFKSNIPKIIASFKLS